MSLLFILLHSLLLFFLRSLPLYRKSFAFLQDLFFLSLSLALPLPFALIAIFLIQWYAVLDALLYRKMKLRMQVSYLSHVTEIKTLYISAKELGLNQLFLALGLVLAIQVAWSTQSIEFYPALTVATGLGTLLSLLCLPKEIGYTVHHPFFLRKNQAPITTAPLHTSQFGPKTFSVSVLPGEKPHVIFLFLESFPAKHMNATNTPYFHRLAQEGIYFPHFYSNGTLTYRALLSGVLGAMPSSTSSGLSPYFNVPFRGIPHLLKEQGYKSAFHHNGPLSFDRQEPFLKKHFDEVVGQDGMAPSPKSVGWGIDDEQLMHYSANWLEKQQQPTFLTLFTISNHHPWIVPKHYQAPPGHRFLQTLHYSDFALGCFIDQLQSKQLSQKSVLFILGDHGQPLGEHDQNMYNSRFLYEENVHIPLLIWAEGRISEPKVIEEVGSQIDLMPTVADLLGLKEPCLGTSLMRKKERIAYLQNPYSEGFIGCRKGEWKWIQNQLSAKEELYSLKQDPEEKENLLSSQPEIAQMLKEQTTQFLSPLDLPVAEEGLAEDVIELPNALIGDEELEQRASVNIKKANLENCLLLTDEGINAFLAKSPQLEELNLKGVSEIKHLKTPLLRLRKLDLSSADQFTGADLNQNAPYLQELSLPASALAGLELGCLVRLKLFEAESMSEEALIALMKKNLHLGRLVVHRGSQLTDEILPHLKQLPLEQLWLYGSPKITEQKAAELNVRSLVLEAVCDRLF